MPAEKTERNQQIIKRYLAGECSAEIAPDFNLSAERVAQIIRRAGVMRSGREAMALAIKRGRFDPKKWAHAFPKGPDDPERERKIIEHLRAGKTYGQISAILGISRSTVAGAVHRYKARQARNASAEAA